MPIIDLFMNRSAPTRLTELVMSRRTGSPVHAPVTDLVEDDGMSASVAYAGREDLSGANAVFGLIGATASIENRQSRRKRDEPGAGSNDLMDALYAQYCQALDDPWSSVAGDWAAPRISPDGLGDGLLHPRLFNSEDQHAPAAGMESIEALLSGTHLMEHAFGSLGGGEVADFISTDPVPEILRLFGPAEFHAAAARRPAALPPSLARREHHSLSIDSALAVPQSVPRYDDMFERGPIQKESANDQA